MTDFSTKSLHFNAIDGYVDIGDVTELSFDTTDLFSISLWFKNTDGYGTLISKRNDDGTNDLGWSISLSNGSIKFTLSDVTGITDNVLSVETINSFNDGFWNHLIATYDGTGLASGVSIYLNNNLESLNTISDNLLSESILNSSNVFIGKLDSSGGDFFDGYMDDVAIYNKELSSVEVETIHSYYRPIDLTTTGPSANLVGFWTMGDGDTFPILTDNSSSSNDGTIINLTSNDIQEDVPKTSIVNVSNTPPFKIGPIQQVGTIVNVIFSSLNENPSFIIVNYKMRAEKSDDTGFVEWTVEADPDFLGLKAPVSVKTNTIVILAAWRK